MSSSQIVQRKRAKDLHVKELGFMDVTRGHMIERVYNLFYYSAPVSFRMVVGSPFSFFHSPGVDDSLINSLEKVVAACCGKASGL